MSQLTLISTSAESKSHKAIKLLLYDQLFEHNKDVIERSLEKYLGKRFADIYFKFKDGKEVAVEIQTSPISVKSVVQRTKDYNNLGIFVLWILYGEGRCVTEPKFPLRAKDIRISMAENYLHKMYGGRVYYINLITKKKDVNISDLFALHFIKPYKKNKRRLFNGRYAHFYYRDTLFTRLENWKILCDEFAGNRIARFYDKNLKSLLKKAIKNLYDTNKRKVRSEKKLINLIKKNFKKQFGLFLVYKCLVELYNEKQIPFDEKYLLKILKSVT